MSGGYGWGGDRSGGSYDDYTPNYSSARSAYNRPAPRGGSLVHSGSDNRSQAPVQGRVMSQYVPSKQALENMGHKIKTSARNVLILALDMTGSMSDWPQEIIARGGTLSDEMAKYLGTTDNEIIIVGFGDQRLGDLPPVVSPEPANDNRLADYLNSLTNQNGFGNGKESSHLPLFYAYSNIDTSSASNVWMMVITDESTYEELTSTEQGLFRTAVEVTKTKDICDLLKRKMEPYCIFCETNAYFDRAKEFKQDWTNIMGTERVVPIEYKQRVVDTILGIIANSVGKGDQFDADIVKRLSHTQYGNINIKSLRQSMASVKSAGSKAIVPMKRKSIITIGEDDDSSGA